MHIKTFLLFFCAIQTSLANNSTSIVNNNVALANNSNIKKSEINAQPPESKVIGEIEQKKSQIVEGEKKQRKALLALYQLNQKLKNIVKDKSKIQNEIDELKIHLDETNRNISELQIVIKKQKANLANRLRAISKMKGSQLMGFLLSSASASDLERNLKILALIAQHDQQQIKEFQSNNHQKIIEKQKLNERLGKLTEKNKDLEVKESRYKGDQATKQLLVERLKKSRLFNLQQISSLREKTKEMNIEDSSLLDSILMPSFYEQRGLLPKPVDGEMVARFGIEKDESYQVQVINKGIYFSVPEGSAVRSVFDGEVSFLGNIPGFGLTVIVDHGDHFYTVYGSNKKTDVEIGQKIKKHQVIAASGIDLKMNKPGTYFEVRHFSEPDDPQKWMKGY